MNKERREAQKARVAEKQKQAEIVVHAISRGATAKDALLEAGYSEATAIHHAKKILKGRYIKDAVVRVGEAITPKSLSSMAKFRLQDLMLNPKADVRVLVQGIRMALETNQELGQNAANLFMQQNNFTAAPPPMAAKILAGKLQELRADGLASGKWQQGDSRDVSVLKEIAQYEAIAAPLADVQSRPPAIQLRSDDGGRTFA